MTKKAAVKKVEPLTRKQMRDQLLGHAPKPVRKALILWGIEVDFVQPTLEAILKGQAELSVKDRSIDMIIGYACVPGTDERVFEEADKELIMTWPFNEDVMNMQIAIADLTGVNIGAAEEDLKTDPLDKQS